MFKAPLRGGGKFVSTFMLGGIVSSELAWIIRTENKQTNLERKTHAQIAISQDIINRMKKGEKVDVEKELLRSEEQEDQSVSSILENLEAVDNRWAQAKGSASNILKQSPQSDETSSQNSSKPKDSKGGWL